MHPARDALFLVLLAATARGQETAGSSAAAGRALLERLVAAQRDVAQITADYVQYRSTPLTSKPLVARGTFAFRREPGCVVFRVHEPRPAVIRLDTRRHEVWLPDRKRLERYLLASEAMPRLLFDALAPTAANLERGFVVESCTPLPDAPALRQVTLRPRDATAHRVAAKITLTLDPEGPHLRGFGYTDPRGGEVQVELSQVQTATKADPALFALDIPADAEVLVQRVPEAEATPAGRDPAKE
jgi:outer membrane lipoprotein-sorting protein